MIPSHERQALYAQLSTSVASGMSLVDGVDLIRKGSRKGEAAEFMDKLSKGLHRGTGFGSSLEKLGQYLPPQDIAVLQAAEESGKLEDAFQRLEVEAHKALLRRRNLIQRLAYPVLLLYGVFLILPIPTIIVDGAASYLSAIWPAYVLTGILAFIFSPLARLIPWRVLSTALDMPLAMLPAISTIRRNLDWERYLNVMHLGIGSGVPLLRCMEFAEKTVTSPAIRAQIQKIREKVGFDGASYADTLEEFTFLDEQCVRYLKMGESTGNLDDMHQRSAKLLEDKIDRAITHLTIVVGSIAFAAVAVKIAWTVVTFWTQHFQSLNEYI